MADSMIEADGWAQNTMGYYIETPVTTGKADWVLANVPGVVEVATPVWTCGEKTLVFVAQNGPFDACAVAYDQREMNRFIMGGNGRKVRYLHVPTAFVLKQLPYLEDQLQQPPKSHPST